MKHLFLSLFLFLNFAFAFDSIEVLDPQITVYKSGYFKTDKNISSNEAYIIAQKGNITTLPKQAKSFGFDHYTYWFFFEVANNSEKEIYLDSKNFVAGYQELFVYDNGKLISFQKSGYFTPIEQRIVKTFPIRFELKKSPKKLIYLLQLNSKSPLYTAFTFGDMIEVDSDWKLLYFFMIFAGAISFAFTIYNFFLYLITKDQAYLFYCVYIVGFLGLNIVGLGYVPIIPFLDVKYAHIYFTIAVFLKLAGLTFFMIYFLKLKERHNRLKLFLYFFLLFHSIFAVLYLIGVAKPLFVLSVQLFMIVSIFVGIKSYISGFKPALYYLIATGVSNFLFVCFSLMTQGEGISYSIWSMNLSNFAMAWELIMLSFALAYRIRILQEENLKNERLAIMKSRQKVIGELTGNIAHQWRQPLNKLGAIISNVEAKLKYDSISHDELIESCLSSSAVLKNLSNTIDTLQDFFINSSKGKEQFDVNEQIDTILHFLQDTMRNQQIQIRFNPAKTLIITSERNLLSQVVMNILLNAKNILIERNNDKVRSIIITTCIHDDKAILTIQDNGGGIEVSPINKIFEPFFSTRTNGSGIGLYMAKNMIEKLGGTLSANNTHEGAQFTIILPK
ncbi:MAG: hypothetical protein A2023_04285 [Sulfuricurvum sp. GWF2_44_89]|uniref:histidine kinase n=1 Tax=Sulfuricurvum kujiense TaxID=148813 RepID=A0A2D3WM95_9BACT|nr:MULTISPECIES: sensor histidine kinase [unclassified Sulfuricurvum]OHD77967.1 MAG: hypothetical protein A2023_04285 [Sulfuricurvum sp. GWF2_44_89]OHD91136.1 MAG: hypothetical protein A2517_10700 [Sulfuricurvum sp. RIFOXYD12_FULL_44_77]OHD93073.1 MAG: hypothetical protein A2552_10800 [Sulfuricurvum sp. RIFOXYD2_FULL_44_160]DAB38229.1 MAG TPA: hypothetical protein CFH83_06975 [Sulfuricurvum kujiense]